MEANERPTKRPDERRACDRPENRDCPSPSRPSVLSLLGRKTVDTVDSGRRRRARRVHLAGVAQFNVFPPLLFTLLRLNHPISISDVSMHFGKTSGAE